MTWSTRPSRKRSAEHAFGRRRNCTLFQHLAGVIISDISHLVTSSEARLTVVYRGSGGADWPPDIADETPNQEQLQEWRSEQQGLLNHLRRVDPKIARMAELTLLHDITNTEDFCRLLKLAPPEVARLRRRMRRSVRAYHAENRP
jgi:hypothetical protein